MTRDSMWVSIQCESVLLPHYLDLSQPDSQITKVLTSSPAPSAEQSAQQALLLQRERPLDVDGARAEWRVAESLLVLYA